MTKEAEELTTGEVKRVESEWALISRPELVGDQES